MSSGLVQEIVGYDPDSGEPLVSDGEGGFIPMSMATAWAPGKVQLMYEWQGESMIAPWVHPSWFDTQAGRDYIAAQGFPMMASKLGIPLSQFLTDPRGNAERFNQLFPQTYSVFADVISSPVTKMFLIPFAPGISDFLSPFVKDLIPSFAADLFSVPINPIDFVSYGSEAILPVAETVATVVEPVLETALQTVSNVSEVVPVDDVLDLFDLADTPAWDGYTYTDEFGNLIGTEPVVDTPFNPYAGDGGYTGSYLPDTPDVLGPPAPGATPAPYPVTPYPMPAPGAPPTMTTPPFFPTAPGAAVPGAAVSTLANLFKSIFTPSQAQAATMPYRLPSGALVTPGATRPGMPSGSGLRPLAPFNINTAELTKFAIPAVIVLGGLYFISRKKKAA